MEMDVQDLAFPDKSFDTVVGTFVFCSVPDPVKGLLEVRRVCRDEGRIILLEHVRSENALSAALMDILNPVAVSLVGCNINRRTMDSIAQAGIIPLKTENVLKKIVKLVIAGP